MCCSEKMGGSDEQFCLMHYLSLSNISPVTAVLRISYAEWFVFRMNNYTQFVYIVYDLFNLQYFFLNINFTLKILCLVF